MQSDVFTVLFRLVYPNECFLKVDFRAKGGSVESPELNASFATFK